MRAKTRNIAIAIGTVALIIVFLSLIGMQLYGNYVGMHDFDMTIQNTFVLSMLVFFGIFIVAFIVAEFPAVTKNEKESCLHDKDDSFFI